MSVLELQDAIGNTLAVLGLAVLLAVPLGTLLAILLVRTNVAGRKLAFLAFSSQIAIPLYVFAGGWSAGFGTQGWLGPQGIWSTANRQTSQPAYSSSRASTGSSAVSAPSIRQSNKLPSKATIPNPGGFDDKVVATTEPGITPETMGQSQNSTGLGSNTANSNTANSNMANSNTANSNSPMIRNRTLWSLSQTAAQRSSVGGWLPVAVLHALASLPWVILLLSCGLAWRQRSREEMAFIEGGFKRLLLKITLPQLRLWLLAACFLVCIPVLTEMVVANLYLVHTLPEQVYFDASRGDISPWTYLAGFALCTLPLIVFGGSVLWQFSRVSDRRYQPLFRGFQPLQLGRGRAPLSVFLWCIVLMTVALPLLNLVIKAGWQPVSDPSGETSYGWSALRFMQTVWESLTLFVEEFYWSGLLAVSATLTSVALCGLFLIGWQHAWWRATVAVTMLTLLAIPGPLVGMLTIHLFNRSEPAWVGMLYDRTLAAPMFAQQFRLLPLTWLMFSLIRASVTSASIEQSRMDRFSPWQVWRYVIWPQTRGKWLTATLLLIVFSVGELSTTILLLPPGVTTLSMRLFEMLHFGMRHQDSGLCGVLILLGWATAVVCWKTLSDR